MSSKTFGTITAALLFAACGSDSSEEPPSKRWPDFVWDAPPPAPSGICAGDFSGFPRRRGGVLLSIDVGSREAAVFRQLDCETGAVSVTGSVVHQPDEHLVAARVTRQGTFMLHLIREGEKPPYPTIEALPDGTVLGMTRGYPNLVDESGALYRPDAIANATGTGMLVKPEVSDYLTRNLNARAIPTVHGLVLEDATSHAWAFVQPDKVTPLPVPTGQVPIYVPEQDIDRVALDERTPAPSGCEVALRILVLPELHESFRGTFTVAASCESVKGDKLQFAKVLRTPQGTTAELRKSAPGVLRGLSTDGASEWLVGFAPEGGPAKAARPGTASFADDTAVYGAVEGIEYGSGGLAVVHPTTLAVMSWPGPKPTYPSCHELFRYEGLRGGPLPTAYPELFELCRTACNTRVAFMSHSPRTPKEEDELDVRMTTTCDRLAGFDPTYRAGCPFCAR